MSMRTRMAVVTALAVTGFVGAACSNSPSTGSNAGGTTTTTAHPPASPHATSSTTTSTTAAASTAPTTAAPPPTLGLAAAWARVGPSSVGFGQVRPSEISLGGDPTGIITGITWQSWGGATAVGTGTSTYVPPGEVTAMGVQVPATVEAFNLGTCAGTPAYAQVKWYFPGEGESFSTTANTTINACTGP